MSKALSELATLDDLRNFVEETICRLQLLLRGSFQFSQRTLVRQGQPCGLHFTLQGPRSVQYSAIWDVKRHTVLFYDSTGERFHRCELAVNARLHAALAVCARDGSRAC